MTYKFSFLADNREEVLSKIKESISSFIDNDSEDPLKYANYEVMVTDAEKSLGYQVEVIARIKNDNR
jgi:endonuclease IV